MGTGWRKRVAKKKLIIEKKIEIIKPYTVIKDSKEQQGWTFSNNVYCAGTLIKGLKTGDYSIIGLENVFTIERKKNTAEFAKNIVQTRFENEMKRMEKIEHSYLILEFTMNDMMKWPLNSGLPPYIQRKIKITKKFLLSRFMDFQTQYNTKIILAGIYGKDIASSLFKRMWDLYGKT
jgi:hypothetical protein